MPGAAGAAGAGSGLSATNVSVVNTKAAMEAAFCKAVRVTLAGSTIPAFYHVDVFFRQRVEANALIGCFNLRYDNRAFQACIGSNLTNRFFNSAFYEVDARLYVAFFMEFIQSRENVDERRAAAGYDAFFQQLRA